MKISSTGNETYLYINGLGVKEKVVLGENIELLPVATTFDEMVVSRLSRDQGEFGVALIFLWLVRSQLHIVSENPKILVKDAWNSLWDLMLFSALFNCDAVSNFQCDKPAEDFSENCNFRVTNHHLRGISKPLYYLNDNDIKWIRENFSNARNLLKQSRFLHAVHCLGTYHWHSLPAAQLALLWSGIESIFNINSELVFRLSLYISRFLEGDDEENKKITFRNVKDLYKQRSAAVHGTGNIKNPNESIKDSANLLKRIILQCIYQNNLPDIENLAP